MSDQESPGQPTTPASGADTPPPGGYPAPGPQSPAGAAPPYPDQYPTPPAYAQPPYPGVPSDHPGYPGGWPPPGSSPARGRPGLIIGIVAAVLVLLAGGVTVALLVSAGNSPRASLEGWFEAARSGDEAGLRSLTCAQYANEEFDPSSLVGLTWEIHDIEQIDDTLVTATVTVHTGDDVTVERWAIVMEGSGWKVCGPVERLERA